ncbi:MAG: SpoIIE family protein phosphatase [Chlorobiales bacterium]|nr:SpoIIE family protein phosphatase [Chlorobiales bacterium]
MQKNHRITYLLVFLIILFEGLLLSVDIGLFYAVKAKAYFLPSGFMYLKDFFGASVFTFIYILIRRQIRMHVDTNASIWVSPTKAVWTGSIFTLVTIGLITLYNFIVPNSEYYFRGIGGFGVYAPESLYSVIKSHLFTLLFGCVLLGGLIIIERLMLFRRTSKTTTNFIAAVALIFLSALTMAGSSPGTSTNFITQTFALLAVLMMLVNAFRISWILPLSRSEKWDAIGLILAFGLPFGILYWSLNASTYLETFSTVVGYFLYGISAFIGLYLTVSFFGILLYLPSSRDYERKMAEIRNLHAMSKFITDVFDEEVIYESLVSYGCEASGPSSSGWLDLCQSKNISESKAPIGTPLPVTLKKSLTGDTGRNGLFKTVAKQNITPEAINHFAERAGFIWQEVVEKKEVLCIDDVLTDRRLGENASPFKTLLRRLKLTGDRKSESIASILSVPLISRSDLLGIIHIAKDVEYGFVKDDIELLTTFADQAAIAIDNSRLIKQLIDKERLQQELLVAQAIQLRLLPQSPLIVKGFDIDGISYPAYEVGGDYYDFVKLNEGEEITKFGIIVADVSGKGTSAAFYMAELKGIFQSLCSIYPDSPKELLKKVNETVIKGLSKNVFISTIYGVVDANTRTLTLVNAGHCPVAAFIKDEKKIIRLNGLALGVDKGEMFNRVLSETHIQLSTGDVVAFYTDGIIEAVDGDGEEFGYDRLLKTIEASRHKSAEEIKNDLLSAVNAFTEPGGAIRDDLTIVVLKAV